MGNCILSVYCLQLGFMRGGTGCVKGCWRRTLHLALSAPQDSQRSIFITTVPPEGRQRLQRLSFWRDPDWREARGRGCPQGECDVTEG